MATPARRVVLRAAAWACAALALAGAADPSPSPTEGGSDLSKAVATCDASADRVAQTVRCELSGVPTGVVVRLLAETDPAEPSVRSRWTGAATAGDDGQPVVVTTVPCDATGAVTVTVAADTDTASFQHREDVTLSGACQPAWRLTGSEWTRAGAAVLVGVALVLVVAAHRRQRHRHRRPRHSGARRGVSGRRGRRGRRSSAGRGRSRPRRSPMRRR